MQNQAACFVSRLVLREAWSQVSCCQGIMQPYHEGFLLMALNETSGSFVFKKENSEFLR